MRSISERICLLVLGLVLCTPACRDPEASPDTTGRSTRPGERLWTLEVRNPGLGPTDMDALVALPFFNVLGHGRGVEVTGSVSRFGRTRIHLRAPVSMSSLVAVSTAAGEIALPPGSERPTFGVAGPLPPEGERVLIELDPDTLARHALVPRDVLQALRSLPAPSGVVPDPAALADIAVPVPDAAPVALGELAAIHAVDGSGARHSDHDFDWTVRVEAGSLDRLRIRLQALRSALAHPRHPSDAPGCLPRWQPVLETELDHDTLRRLGIPPRDVHLAVRAATGHQVRVRAGRPVYLRLAPASLEEIGRHPVRTSAGVPVPLGQLARFLMTEQPIPVLRTGPDTLAGFVLLASQPDARSITRAGSTEGSPPIAKHRGDLSDAERALLGWPRRSPDED